MYYNRTLSPSFSALIEPHGSLRWLFDFVKSRSDLDFQIGKNSTNEWVSVYRGLSRMVSIQPTNDISKILLHAADAYKKIAQQKSLNIYGIKPVTFNFQKELLALIGEISGTKKYDKYYNHKKEGYFQNKLSRKYSICGDPGTDFVIIDKEAVIGYSNQAKKNKLFGLLQLKYKKCQKEISDADPKRYGKNLQKKAIGNELDFMALDKEGNILLIECKDGSGENTSGIYLSPLQIGLYYEVFSNFPKKELENAVYEMLAQKKKIGLINPLWKTPEKIKEIIPVLVVSEYKYKGSAKQKFDEVLQNLRQKFGNSFLRNIQKYNYTTSKGLAPW
jgi:hypothetical protein